MMGVVGQGRRAGFLFGAAGRGAGHVHPGRPAAASAGQPQAVEVYLEVEDVDALDARLQKKGVPIVDPLTLQWWGDRTFKVQDPNGYVVWFYTNVSQPKPPQGMKVV